MSDEIKMCKDCKWRGRAWFISAGNQYCYNPEVVKSERKNFPADDGKAYAKIARMYGPCYHDGKFWEKR